jgi:outer membrane immunogenic protein
MNMRMLPLAVLAAASLAASPAARASDLYPPMQRAPAYNASNFDFGGMYLGALLGAGIGSTTDGTIGVAIGVNFTGLDPLAVGTEVQGGVYDHGGIATYDLLALAHLGVLVTDSIMAYGALGGGFNTTGSFQAEWAWGGGVEMAVSDSLSARVEALRTSANSGTTKLTAGLLWHLR